jgi:hypothetical protein
VRVYILIPILFILVGSPAFADSSKFHSAIQSKLESVLGRLSSQELNLKPINTELLKDLGILNPDSDCAISKGSGDGQFDSLACPTSALSEEFDGGAGKIIAGEFLRVDLYSRRGDLELTRLIAAATSLGFFVKTYSREPESPVTEFCRGRSTELVSAFNIKDRAAPSNYRVKGFEVIRDCRAQQFHITIAFFQSR